MDKRVEIPAINFNPDFFSNIVKEVVDELKQSQPVSKQQSPKANKHDTRQKVQGPPQPSRSIDVESISIIVSCITRALTPIITDTIKLALANVNPAPVNAMPVDESVNLKLEIDDMNMYSRRDSCRINGLTECDNESEEELLDKIIDVSKLTGAKIDKNDISVAHRLPIEVKGVKQCIVKFSTRRAKMEFYSSRTKLKEVPGGKDIYITEDLTKLRYKLLMEAKKCVGCSGVVTNNGIIKVWREGFKGAVHIKHPSDLEKVGLKPDYKALGLM